MTPSLFVHEDRVSVARVFACVHADDDDDYYYDDVVE